MHINKTTDSLGTFAIFVQDFGNSQISFLYPVLHTEYNLFKIQQQIS